MSEDWRENVYEIRIIKCNGTRYDDTKKAAELYELRGYNQEGEKVHDFIGTSTDATTARSRAKSFAKRIGELHPCTVLKEIVKNRSAPLDERGLQLLLDKHVVHCVRQSHSIRRARKKGQ